MNTVTNIFNYIQGLNATSQTMSSIGTYVTEQAKQVADMNRREVVDALVNDGKTNTLAFTIASTATHFSEKQLWVIANELNTIESFCNLVNEFNAKIQAKIAAKNNASKSKLEANKAASSDILAPIKAAKKLGEFGKWLNTSGNPFRKEHFSKKYTQQSVNAFLAL